LWAFLSPLCPTLISLRFAVDLCKEKREVQFSRSVDHKKKVCHFIGRNKIGGKKRTEERRRL